MSQNDSSENVEKWRSGVVFSFAWYQFAEPYAVRKHNEINSRRAISTQRLLMVADLWARLNSGELEAFGKSVAPVISDGPVLIPPHTFEFRPPQGAGDSDEIEVAGWRYVEVTIVRPDSAGLDEDTLPTRPVVKAKRGGGRSDTYQYSEGVLHALYAVAGNDRLSAEKLHPAFKLAFQSQFPREHHLIDAPSVRTLRKQIGRFRKKLAQTGCN